MKYKKNKYLKTGISLVGTSVAVVSIPNISGTTGEANIKSKFSEGISNTGKVLPVMGKIKGTQMVLKPISKLKSKANKLGFRKGYKL